MTIEVSDTACREATECDKQFSCLSEKDWNLCRVTKAIGSDGSLFIEPSSGSNICPYHLALDGSHRCLCPVRKDLYNRYGL